MPRPCRRLKQLELYRPQSTIPDWKTLPANVQERVLQELARMFCDTLDRITPGQEQGGSSNE